MNFSIYKEASKVKVLVIGDLMLDNYLVGSCNRISPEAPVQVVDINNEKHVLGGAGNVINNLISLGAQAGILSVLGKDKTAVKIIDHFDILGVNHKIIFEENRITSIKNRIIVDKHQIMRFDKESKDFISKKSEDDVINSFQLMVDDFDIVVLSDYGKGVLTNCLISKVIQVSNEKGKKVIVDPKGTDFTKYCGAYLLTPNKNEAEKALNVKIDDEDSLRWALNRLKDCYKLEVALITLSEDGIAYFNEDYNKRATKAKDVFDVTGAGDTVLASMAIGLALNLNIDLIVDFANAAAGVVVGKSGSATTTLDEINHIYNSRGNYINESKLLDLDSILLELRRNESRINSKIVFTIGNFDIFQVGHVSYLESARRLGDILIVGLNSDRRVQLLKGECHPINKELDRAKILCALNFVDYVVILDHDDSDSLVQKIKPNIIVKGGDSAIDNIIGSEFADEVYFIEF